MLESVDLLTLDEPVHAPVGIIYSTAPRTATTECGKQYFVKGPEPEIAFAELAGCLLARAVGLSVAPVALCTFGGRHYCGSEKVADVGRNAAPFFRNPTGMVTNFNELYSAIVVDAWLANTDRNQGNVVARPVGNGTVEFVLIDFEQSKTLRPNPIIGATMVKPDALWPTGELGQALRRLRPMQPPPVMVGNIRSFVKEPDRVAAVITAVCDRLGTVEWSQNSLQAVVRRGSAIAKISEEVWSLQ